MSERLNVCHECGTEYQKYARVCSDCNVPLVRKEKTINAVINLKEEPNLVLIRLEEPNWVKEFADILASEGIPSMIRVESPPDGARSRNFGMGWKYGIYVRPADADRAGILDEQYWTRLLETDVSVGRRESADDQNCSASGAWAGVGAEECPSFGLYLECTPTV